MAAGSSSISALLKRTKSLTSTGYTLFIILPTSLFTSSFGIEISNSSFPWIPSFPVGTALRYPDMTIRL